MVADPSFCLFRSGSRPLAVPVEDVAEIVETESVVKISGCPPRIAGLCAYHRHVVPVVALDPAGEPVPAAAGPAGCAGRQAVLILRTAQGPWGIRIDRDGTTITAARPERHEPRRGEGGCVSVGVIREGGGDFVLLDPGLTWQAARDLVASWYAESGEAPPRPARLAAGAAVPSREDSP